MTRFDPLRIPLTGTHLVEAGAGTGKTWGLTALYLRLIAEGRHRPRDIAVVTFTEAATRELRGRVRDRLVLLAQRMASRTPSGDPVVEALAQQLADEAGARARIERAALELDDATIATIHGFCRRVLSDFALDAAQPFATLEPDDGSLMRARAVRDFWRRTVVAGDPAEVDWVLSWLASSDALVKWIEEALRVPPERVMPQVDPAALAGLHAALEVQRARAPRAALLRAASELGTTSALSRSASAHSPYHGATFARLVAELRAWLEHVQEDAPLEAISALTAACIASHRNSKRGAGWEPAEPAAHAWAGAALAAALDHAYARRSAFLQRVLADVRVSIAAQKREQRVLSFDDLVGDLRDVLATSPDVVDAIRARHAVALVDEFQDTDADQYAIFRALFHGRADGALYLIGDPKQAIYRFRGGDVFAYRAAARDAGENLWTLDDNWRSDERLIEAVNALFDERRAVRPFVHEFIAFRRAGYGAPRTQTPAMAPIEAPLVVWTIESEDAQAKGELSTRIHDAVAAEIEKLLAEPHANGVPSIAVLVRDKYEVAGAAAALGRRGIGTSYTSAQSVYDEPEATELVTVLEALADPADLRRGRAALATELGGFDHRALRAMKTDGSALDEALSLLAQWREIALAHGPAALARTLAQRVGPRWLARHDGRRRMTNLAHVGEALQREAGALPGLPAQAAWLARRIASGLHPEDAELRPDASGAPVAVLTVHKSKGLEWDVVFAPFLWCGRRDAYEQDRVALERRLPVGFHGAEGGLRVDLGSDEWDDHMAQKLAEVAAESVRLAYVALTRARHRAYTFWGCAKMADSSPLAHLLHPCGEVPIDRDGVARQLGAWSAHARGAVAIVPLPSATDDQQVLAQNAAAQNAASAGAAAQHADGAAPPSGVIPAKAGTQRLGSARKDAPHISARPFRTPINRSFRVLSYSALFGESDDARPDHDETAASVPFLGPGPVPSSPRGPKFGECVHSILEHYDAQDASANERRIDERCREFGYGVEETAVVRSLVHETFRAEVLPRVSLSALATRRTELEFFFPLADTRIEDVAAALALDPRYARTEAEFAALRPRWIGLMHGYVDLVFAHEGRYGLIDYKTNFLGTRHEDYAAEPLARAVRASDYDLQYLIYTVALVRQLRARLGARFDYARDFAGVAYLFLRGLAGGHGVHRDVPPQDVIAALDRAFGGGP